MAANLEKRVQWLTAYVVFITALCGYLVFSSYKNAGKRENLDELTVKRINIVDESGKLLRLVISNETRQHPGRSAGVQMPKRERPAGLLFFNDDGDECGGLTYYVSREKNSVSAGTLLTMDQYHNDQVVHLMNDEAYDSSGKATWIRRGLAVNDIPIGLELTETMKKYETLKQIADPKVREEKIRQLRREEGGRNRLFVGRNDLDEYGLFLMDSAGSCRFKIFIDASGSPKMQTMDASGKSLNLPLR
ncbi:hypothetical protein [Taibaiella koreensis]|uniref:hypothetical protein n=1 Tax=Taibaiella koreensis TaxID=1268548 RepID=UPI000E59F0B4|nr:hypothetical protein [Taibaiella koreensis]